MITHAGAYHHQQSREAEDAGDMDVRETQAPAHWRKDDKKKGLPGGENRQLCPGCRGFKVQTWPPTLSLVLSFRTVPFGELS